MQDKELLIGKRKLLAAMDMCSILTIEMVAQINTEIKTFQNYILQMCNLWYKSYTSIYTFLKAQKYALKLCLRIKEHTKMYQKK